MARKDNTMNYAMLAVGGWLLYEYLNGNGLLAGTGLAPAPTPAEPAPEPVPAGGSNGGTPPPPPAGEPTDDPRVLPLEDWTVSSLRRAMVSVSSNDPNPMNLWRWNWYYRDVTGGQEPGVWVDRVFPGKTNEEIEQIAVTWDAWYAAVSNTATSDRPLVLATDAESRRSARGRMGGLGMAPRGREAWGQNRSGQMTGWATGGARSRTRYTVFRAGARR